MKRLSLVLAFCLSSFHAFAACNSGSWTPAQGPQLDANGNQCVTVAGTTAGAPALRAYGTIALTTASVAVSTLTLGSNSPAWTSPFSGSFTVISRSTSAGSAYVCPFAGTCSTSNGVEVPPGASRSFYLGSTQAPTIVAASTATVEVYQ